MDPQRDGGSGRRDAIRSLKSPFPLGEELILAGCEVRVGREAYESPFCWN